MIRVERRVLGREKSEEPSSRACMRENRKFPTPRKNSIEVFRRVGENKRPITQSGLLRGGCMSKGRENRSARKSIKGGGKANTHVSRSCREL